MDWIDDTQTDIYANPAGVTRGEEMGANAFTWTSQYGLVISSMYGFITVDGMNEAGLVSNALYLAESDFGHQSEIGLPVIHVAAATQFILDMHGSVAEVVETFKDPPFAVLAPALSN